MKDKFDYSKIIRYFNLYKYLLSMNNKESLFISFNELEKIMIINLNKDISLLENDIDFNKTLEISNYKLINIDLNKELIELKLINSSFNEKINNEFIINEEIDKDDQILLEFLSKFYK